ncbi:MAG: hypothetical protein JWL97_3506 [Gemmatimonadales bacterium]|nr:hypothetical protein [Gemmatimonadales bacterium]
MIALNSDELRRIAEGLALENLLLAGTVNRLQEENDGLRAIIAEPAPDDGPSAAAPEAPTGPRNLAEALQEAQAAAHHRTP